MDWQRGAQDYYGAAGSQGAETAKDHRGEEKLHWLICLVPKCCVPGLTPASESGCNDQWLSFSASFRVFSVWPWGTHLSPCPSYLHQNS